MAWMPRVLQAAFFVSSVLVVVLFLGTPVLATDLVRFGVERNFLRYASVESKQIRIHWNPRVPHLPQAAVDFLGAASDDWWDTSLDGIGDRNEQVLAVHWKEAEDAVGFELQLKYASNETHWFINQIVLQAGNLVATGLYASAYSNSHKIGHRGHVLAAKKGYPFECHYLEIPFIVVDFLSCGSANSSSAPKMDLRSDINIGDTLAVLIMEDFLISGWEGVSSMKLVNRLEVEPCGLKHCGIQAMKQQYTDLGLQLLNTHELLNTDSTLAGERPEWYRFKQEKGWLPPMERVCGTQKEVDAMKHSHKFSASSQALVKHASSMMMGSVVTVMILVVVGT